MISEEPRPQTIFQGEVNGHAAEASAFFLERNLQDTDIDPKRVQTVTDLGCGNGMLVAGALLAFPEATVYAVDYHDVLEARLKQNKRVTFHQGRLVDVLSNHEVPDSDVVLLANIGRTHGFTENNIHLLQRLVKGVLLTTGDNAYLEARDWFRNPFTIVKSDPRSGDIIWKVNHPQASSESA